MTIRGVYPWAPFTEREAAKIAWGFNRELELLGGPYSSAAEVQKLCYDAPDRGRFDLCVRGEDRYKGLFLHCRMVPPTK